MRLPERRKVVMQRSMALGHCICNPMQNCPCEILIQQDLCPCAGERPDVVEESIRLTRFVQKAGCASKVSQADLEYVLRQLKLYEDPRVLIGMAAGDDAGVYQLEGDLNLVQTVDVFTPVVDDPYTFGEICAANSLSDVYAMGARPLCALSIIGFPVEKLPREVMRDILQGGLDKMQEAGVSVIGGHSINDEEVKCGFAVTGLISGFESVAQSAAQPGDALVLTKPIGTGLISFAAQMGRASAEAIELMGHSMRTLNRDAAELMQAHHAHACTDVTGFGFLGHLSLLARHSGVTARVNLSEVPVFGEALGCIKGGMVPGGVERNRESFAQEVVISDTAGQELVDLLYDPQTSGGLLISLPKDRAEPFIQAMRAKGHSATCCVGEVLEKKQKALVEVIPGEPTHLVGRYRIPERMEPPVVQHVHPSSEAACCEEPPDLSGVGMSISSSKSEVTSMSENPSAAEQAYQNWMKAASAPGLLDARAKRLVSIALSISQKCEPCLKIHVRHALAEGISRAEIDELAWTAVSFTGCSGRMFYLDIMKQLEKQG